MNCISHLLGLIPYEDVTGESVELGERDLDNEYDDKLDLSERQVIPQVY